MVNTAQLDTSQYKYKYTARLGRFLRHDLVTPRPVPTLEPRLNKFLAVLPAAEYALLRTSLQPVTLKTGQTIYNVGDSLDFIYFPETCVASRVALMEDGATVEVGLVGPESIIGVMSFLGAETARHWTVVEVPGRALRMRASAFRDLARRNYQLQKPILDYCRLFFAHVAQRSVCRSRHSIQEQLCTWLMMMQDRAGTAELPLTQESIARRLGVRRAGITVAANWLKQEGLIDYRRGHIAVLDRKGLEKAACECYGVVQTDFQQYMAAAA